MLTKEELLHLKLPRIRKMKIHASRDDILDGISEDSFLELADKND